MSNSRHSPARFLITLGGLMVFSLRATLPAQAQAPAAKPTVAVLTFDVEHGVTEDEARILADRLAIELDRTGEFTLIQRQRMAEQLELQNFSLLTGCAASECAVEAGRILGATYMVYGSIGKVGDTFSLNTYLVAVESGSTLQSAATDTPDAIEVLLTDGISRNAAKLADFQPGQTTADAASRPTCAVLTFDSRGGISADEVRLFSDRFAIELDRLRAYTLVPRTKMEEVLKEQQFSRSENCSAAECAMEAGKLLGVRYMAYGSIGKLGALYTVNSYLVDVETSAAVKTATTDFPGTKEDMLIRGMAQNARSLVGTDLQQGYLNIHMTPAHATLTVNGQRIAPGLIPVAADSQVMVSAEASGYHDYRKSWQVETGETLQIFINLNQASANTWEAWRAEKQAAAAVKAAAQQQARERTPAETPASKRPKMH